MPFFQPKKDPLSTTQPTYDAALPIWMNVSSQRYPIIITDYRLHRAYDIIKEKKR